MWGKVSGRQSSSSNDLLMKGRDWVTGDEVVTELLNEKGKVTSLRMTSKSRKNHEDYALWFLQFTAVCLLICRDFSEILKIF